MLYNRHYSIRENRRNLSKHKNPSWIIMGQDLCVTEQIFRCFTSIQIGVSHLKLWRKRVSTLYKQPAHCVTNKMCNRWVTCYVLVSYLITSHQMYTLIICRLFSLYIVYSILNIDHIIFDGQFFFNRRFEYNDIGLNLSFKQVINLKSIHSVL